MCPEFLEMQPTDWLAAIWLGVGLLYCIGLFITLQRAESYYRKLAAENQTTRDSASCAEKRESQARKE